jgi:hypothetical protein
MDKFLKKIETDLKEKILTCVNGESIVKPFSQVYEEVREKHKKKESDEKEKIYVSEDSIYKDVIQKFLKEHPELIKKIEEE